MDQSLARRIMNDATLPSGNRATKREQELGRWEIPVDAKSVQVDTRISKFLFAWHPQWALICTYDPSHLHTNPKGKTRHGCWWIFEANPFKIPRTWYPVMPLIGREVIEGGIAKLVFDRHKGDVLRPAKVPLNVLAEALAHKDIYNTTVHDKLSKPVSDIDKHNDGLKDVADKAVEKFDEEFTKEVLSDIAVRAGVPRRAQPILDQYGNEAK